MRFSNNNQNNITETSFRTETMRSVRDTLKNIDNVKSRHVKNFSSD